MEKTINGHTKEEMLDLLMAEIPSDRLDHTWDGYAYYGMQVYQDRLNEVVGGGNYDYIEDGLCETTVHGVTAINIRGTITVRYDDGSICLQRSVYGSENVGVRSASAKDSEGGQNVGDPNNLSNSVKAAATDAFVQCCRKLGIADRQLRDIRNADKKKGRTSQNRQKSESEEFKVQLVGGFTGIGEKGFKIPIVMNGERMSVKLWVDSEAYAQITKCMGTVQNFVTKCKDTPITIKGKKGVYRGESEIEATSLVLKKSA